MMQTQVSVIVPIYNASKHLRNCLDSLSCQTLKSIEFLLIDDGSTDDSGSICDEYAERDSRFKVVHQSNGGTSIARQVGLDLSIGEYVIICDSDDWTEPDMYEKLYNKAKLSNADMVMCQFWFEYANGKRLEHVNMFNTLSGDEFILNIMKDSSNNGSWTKLIRRNLFKENNISYQPGINMGEDALILYKILLTNPYIVQIPDILYHYRREFSSNTYTNHLSMNQIRQIEFIHNWKISNFNSHIVKQIQHVQNVNLAFSYLRAIDLDKNRFKYFLRTNLKWKDLFINKITLKTIFVYATKILPINFSLFIKEKFYPYVYK